MAKSKSKDRGAPVWNGFVRCELNTKRKDEYRAWFNPEWSVEDYLEKMLEPKYKLSLSLDLYHDCVQASWSCTDLESENNGWTLTGRGSTILSALSVLYFKHAVVLESRWTSALPADSDYDDIG